jgi:hypothetical protein
MNFDSQEKWFVHVQNLLRNAVEVDKVQAVDKVLPSNKPVIVVYNTHNEFSSLAKHFSVMYDEKVNILLLK